MTSPIREKHNAPKVHRSRRLSLYTIHSKSRTGMGFVHNLKMWTSARSPYTNRQALRSAIIKAGIKVKVIQEEKKGV